MSSKGIVIVSFAHAKKTLAGRHEGPYFFLSNAKQKFVFVVQVAMRIITS